jgi:hypothetical protein
VLKVRVPCRLEYHRIELWRNHDTSGEVVYCYAYSIVDRCPHNICLVLYIQSTRRSLPQTSSAFFLPFVSGTYHEMNAKKKADSAAKMK